ncbi:MAG: NADH-quinone oxidoreductase subunit C [Sneathiella sp.]|nr:NADH-quinone oxidoreductase subunit C [Sneathiella sp.]
MKTPAFIDQILERFAGHVRDDGPGIDMYCISVGPDHIVALCQYLKEDPSLKFNFLSDLCGVDHYPEKDRYEVVYHLFSIPLQHRLRLKCRPQSETYGDAPSIPTVTGVWRTANWAERECYDMYGIEFSGHPNLLRIYMWEGFEGYPMRKDFPVKGYKDAYNPFGEEKRGGIPDD